MTSRPTSVPGRGYPRPRAQRGRAFTLLEIIIAIVLMLGIAALVLPLTLQDADRAAWREAQEQMEAVMMSARADAQRGARAVRVMAVESEGRWFLREEEVGTGEGSIGYSTRPRIISEHVLPAGIRLALTRGAAEGRSADDAALDADESGFDQPESDAGVFETGTEEQESSFQVALFLPDGQIAPTSPLYMGSGGGDGQALGKVGTVTVNGWTGIVKVEVLEPVTDEFDAGAGMDDNEPAVDEPEK